MVYESDFYTTRRPYSRPSPSITSYSVTAQPYHRNLPFVAHKRLTAPQAPPPRSKLRNSVLMAEIDRINHRVRPHPAYVPTEDWLNSACSTYQLMRKTNFRVDPFETRSVATEDPVEPSPYWRLRSRVRKGELPLCAIATYDIYRLEMFFHDLVQPYHGFDIPKMMRYVVLPFTYRMKCLDSAVPERFRYEYKDNFDDETRSIRAQTAALLKRVHSPIPRSRGPLHVVLPTPSSLMETPVPHRHTSDHYIEGLLAPINKVQRDVASRSFYVEHPRPYIGKGNLACVSFAGGKAYGKRRSHYDVPEDHHNVQDDIATLSYYNRARAVANGQEPGPEPAATSSRKARQYRPSTDSAAKAEPKAAEPAAAAAPRPAAAPIRQASVKEDPVAEAAAEAELAAETKAAPAPVSNGVAEADDEAARLAAEEAELERQLEAELRAEMEAKEAKKAKKAAAKKAADEAEAKKAAEEAEAKKAAEEAAAKKKAEEEAAAAAAADAEAAAAAAAAAEAEAAAAAAKKAAEEEAELEKIVAAELEAERQAAEAKKAEEEKAAAEAAAQSVEPAEPAAEEVSNDQEAIEPEPEADSEPAVEAETEAPAEEAEPEPEPTPEPADEPEPEPEPEVAEAEPETAASPEPEAIAEDDPVVEEPASEAQKDEVEDAKSDEDAGWPLDEE